MSSTNSQSNFRSSGKLWTKVKSSTKSISTSFQNLSMKSEHDGDSVTTTVIHKALVKYYTKQEPFQGFPGWLGQKTDLPDEQRLLEKHEKARTEPSSIRHEVIETESTIERYKKDIHPKHPEKIQRRTPGSSVFRGIVSSNEMSRTAKETTNTSTPHHVEATTTNLDISLSSTNDSHELFSQRSMFNRMRLKRVDTSSSIRGAR